MASVNKKKLATCKTRLLPSPFHCKATQGRIRRGATGTVVMAIARARARCDSDTPPPHILTPLFRALFNLPQWRLNIYLKADDIMSGGYGHGLCSDSV